MVWKEANSLSLSLSLSLTHTHTHTRQDWMATALNAYCCFLQLLIYLLIYHFEQESRIRQENIVKMNILQRAIRQHYKMKRRFDFEWRRRARKLYSVIQPGPLDRIASTTELLQSSFSIEPRPPRSGDLGPIVLARIRARLLCSHMSKRTELRG